MKKWSSLPHKHREIIADAALERYVRTNPMVLDLSTEHGRVISPEYLKKAGMSKEEMKSFLDEHKDTIIAVSDNVRDALLFYARQVNICLVPGGEGVIQDPR